ncbi:MAG: FAD-binding oxidoreductase [Bacteriovoracaceae bacterium]
MIKLILILNITLSISLFANDDLKPFKTDYCTGFPEGTINSPNLWGHCCLLHDLLLWAGGARLDREQADLTLKSCVEKVGARKAAVIMYLGVKAGKYSPYKIPGMQWGNGWSHRPVFAPLAQEEIDQLESEISKNDYSYIPELMKRNFINILRERLE